MPGYTHDIGIMSLLALGGVHAFYHGETFGEKGVALLDGVVVSVAQKLLGGAVLGHHLESEGIFEQLVDGAVGNLLDCWLDQLPDC
jgi:hypothetical protein